MSAAGAGRAGPSFVDGPALRWGAWHGDSSVRVPVGAGWSVDEVRLPSVEPLGDDAIDASLRAAVGARLGDVGPETTVAIGIDDMARPTPSVRFVPRLVELLLEAGARAENLRVIVATGSHRPLTRIDLEKKLGPAILDEIAVCSHNPYENLDELPASSRGTPVRLNRDFVRADRRIVCGCVMPHPYMGFGGGAKMVLPGLAGIDSLEANHRSVLRGLTGGHLTLDGNEARADVEEVARALGVDLAVQVVVDARRELVSLEAGDVVDAHRAAAATARALYTVSPPEGSFDVVVLGAYPKDGEQYQLGNAFNALRSAGRNLLAPGGSLVIVARCSEGLGHHGLQGRGMRLHRTPKRQPPMEEGREIVVFSPGLGPATLGASFHEGSIHAADREALVRVLDARHGSHARALVIPCAPLVIFGDAS